MHRSHALQANQDAPGHLQAAGECKHRLHARHQLVLPWQMSHQTGPQSPWPVKQLALPQVLGWLPAGHPQCAPSACPCQPADGIATSGLLHERCSSENCESCRGSNTPV